MLSAAGIGGSTVLLGGVIQARTIRRPNSLRERIAALVPRRIGIAIDEEAISCVYIGPVNAAASPAADWSDADAGGLFA